MSISGQFRIKIMTFTPDLSIRRQRIMKPEKAKEYLEQGGLACPFCGSWDIAGGSMDFDAGEIAQRISCPKCNEQWTDVYKLAAVADSDSGATIASISIPAE